MSQVIAATDETFESDVLQSDVPVVLDFHAKWCGPCRHLGPIMDQLASELGDTARVVKVDIDESPALADAYGIQSIPTIMFVKNGQVVEQQVGAMPLGALKERVARL